jgi:adenine phosphoribosyltransferase
VNTIQSLIRDVPDFPKPGILFKDITPLLQDAAAGREVVAAFKAYAQKLNIDAVVGIESRGFMFGYALALELNVPFIPVRKSGKLPYQTIGVEYALEYGTAKIEMHVDALKPGMRVLVHDDLLATGGTAAAAAQLIEMQQAKVEAFTFVVELDFLKGRDPLKAFSSEVYSLVRYAD